MSDILERSSRNLAKNLQTIRDERSCSQEQLSKLTQIPRATLSQLESGTANPTLELLLKLSVGLGISIEELISSPTLNTRLISADDVPLDKRSRNGVTLRKLLPDPLPSTEIDELRLNPDSFISGTPHIEGTREYFSCIKGEFTIRVLGESHRVQKGDVLCFPGDKSHSYKNSGKTEAIGVSVVLLVAQAALL